MVYIDKSGNLAFESDGIEYFITGLYTCPDCGDIHPITKTK